MHKETVSEILGQLAGLKRSASSGSHSCPNVKQMACLVNVDQSHALHWACFQRTAANSSVAVMFLPGRGLESTHLVRHSSLVLPRCQWERMACSQYFHSLTDPACLSTVRLHKLSEHQTPSLWPEIDINPGRLCLSFPSNQKPDLAAGASLINTKQAINESFD